MAALLLNLRMVPQDEADDVRAWLRREAIAFHETAPSPWGVSHGGIWLDDKADLARARALMAQYQQQRRAQAVAAREQALREGRQETFAGQLRQQPGQVLAMVVAIVVVLAVSLLLPWWLLG